MVAQRVAAVTVAAAVLLAVGASASTASTSQSFHYTLNVSVSGPGAVFVSGQECRSSCTYGKDSKGGSFTLEARPDSLANFTGWGGECSGGASTCNFTFPYCDNPCTKSVSASFFKPTYRALVLAVTGPGEVIIDGTQQLRERTFQFGWVDGTTVKLEARPDPGAVFAGWQGACSGVDPTCQLKLGQDVTVSAAFQIPATPQATEAAVTIPDATTPPGPDQLPPPAAALSSSVFGNGTVLLEGRAPAAAGAAAPRIRCGLAGFDCYASFTPGAAVTLRAKPGKGFRFARWTGACRGRNPVCRLRLGGRTTAAATAVAGANDRSVTANFSAAVPTVRASLSKPRFTVGWRASAGTGTVVVKGRLSRSADVRVRLGRPGGGPLVLKRIRVTGGIFQVRLPVGARYFSRGAQLFPGPFVFSLTGRGPGFVVPLQLHTVSLSQPPEGVVRTATASATQSGPTQRVPAGSKQAWARFRFEVQPRAGLVVLVRWYYPDGRLLGEARKANRPDITSYIETKEALPSGAWVAELRAGGRIVKRLRVQVG